MTRVLVVGPSWVGDMVMAQTLFKRIARMDPSAEIHVIGPGWSVPITSRMPEVARSYVLDVPHGTFGLAPRRMLGRALKPMAFDVSFVMPRSFKSALVPFFAGVPRRRGYRGEMRFGLVNDMVPPAAKPLPGAPKIRTVDQFVAMADPSEPVMRPAEAPYLERDASSEAETRTQLGLPDTPAVALCPGAEYGPSKQWPVDYFAGLASNIVAGGREVWITGSAKDRDAGETIAKRAGEGVRVLAGGTSLAQAIDLLAMADAVVTNDSGLMHVAAALGKPTVALYGSTSELVTPPLSGNAVVLSQQLDCRPCFERTCPLEHHDCMKKTTPPDVLAALDRLEKSGA
ncbi:MAG: lipopolysaccharide heptosyltransferase II [Rhodobiaceae bacterium]|nr:lipopolysaccharide heptosyltransferase II [Rhodobiaceae bacterium]